MTLMIGPCRRPRFARVAIMFVLLLGMARISGAATAQELPLDPVLASVPAELAMAIVIRDVDRFVASYSRFAERSGANEFGDVSSLRESGLGILGLDAGTDPNGAAMLVAIDPPNGDFIGLDHLAIGIPISDFEAALASIGIDRNRFGPDGRKVVTRNRDAAAQRRDFVLPCLAMTERHLWFALAAAPLETIVRSERSWFDALGPERARALADRELLILFDAGSPMIARMLHDDLERRLDEASVDSSSAGTREQREEETDAEATRILEVFEELDRLAIGLSFDDSLSIVAQAIFDGARSRKLLDELAEPPPFSRSTPRDDIDRLGARPIMTLRSGRGIIRSSRLVRLVTGTSLSSALPFVDTEPLLREIPDLYDLLQTVGDRLDGVEIRWVANDAAETDGAYAARLELASSEPSALRERLREWERWIELSQGDEATFRAAIDRPSIDGLIGDLGADEFATREAASRRLARVARFIERELNDAAGGSDLEVAFRAQALIQTAREQREHSVDEELSLLARLEPRLAEIEATADEAARGLTRLRLQLSGEEAFWSSEAERLFGPRWDRMTLAERSDRLTFILGSNEAWIEAQLKQATVDGAENAEPSPDADRADRVDSIPADRIVAMLSVDVASWLGSGESSGDSVEDRSLAIAIGAESERLMFEGTISPEAFRMLRDQVRERSRVR
ncbi:MAG TPA: hypothetical protein PLI18_10230 [Pirellulaceae bacterium]|nr:hypothetical protein [Pirellulaceae bacterium]